MTSSAEPLVVTPNVLKSMPLPDSGSDKDSRGHVVVVAGSATTPGAAALAAEAALRAGAGKLTVLTCPATAVSLALALPEAKVDELPVTSSGHPTPAAADFVLAVAADADAVLVGCGYVDPDAALSFLRSLVPHLDTPLILDATASVYVREEPSGLHHLEGRCVLTVNPSELALTDGNEEGEPPSDVEETATRVADRSRAVVLCGGPDKYVISPDGRRWVFTGGGPTLGVSGSGDVQAGIVAGLVARGAEPAYAAVWGAYLHGRAGERLAAEVGPVGSLAREQPGQVPQVLREIH
jgi:ADP-dependent NAD(P)H-hydrate dehydratase